MCCIIKMYSKLLNTRLQKYLDENNILVNEQNGFRASRSCIDHIYALCTILRNRKLLGQDTFLAFIDFQKAFDSVERNLFLYKLSKMGICGNFLMQFFLCTQTINPELYSMNLKLNFLTVQLGLSRVTGRGNKSINWALI